MDSEASIGLAGSMPNFDRQLNPPEFNTMAAHHDRAVRFSILAHKAHPKRGNRHRRIHGLVQDILFMDAAPRSGSIKNRADSTIHTYTYLNGLDGILRVRMRPPRVQKTVPRERFKKREITNGQFPSFPMGTEF